MAVAACSAVLPVVSSVRRYYQARRTFTRSSLKPLKLHRPVASTHIMPQVLGATPAVYTRGPIAFHGEMPIRQATDRWCHPRAAVARACGLGVESVVVACLKTSFLDSD
ncbi:uncharacterized protein SETTUDRAFT_162425 [Exserohilum turcica Et28A]|uniref:Uncharacterized protein n=1 Tax=Exserohilum turcicum (strain 28A) TaxID=671987 RepID=R0J4I6_EXST2|nr:uncharacterized protein SETTUDRAFT_162425 [Exserohilum turcica Et28A]EOA91855.1 hypothetical protein SETTUDRAFT_162425 [Exserohilum turcica Et28A]